MKFIKEFLDFQDIQLNYTQLNDTDITEIDQKLLNKKHYKDIKDDHGHIVKVFIVNGEYIREHIFWEYIEGGHGQVYSFIPRDEIWIDEDNITKKSDFEAILLHEIKEYQNMKYHKMSYEKAHNISNGLETKYRKAHCDLTDSTKFYKQIGDFKIYLVDGEFVRDNSDITFVNSSNYMINDKIPKNQIWIEDNIEDEIDDYIEYEITYLKMRIDFGMSHDIASEYAENKIYSKNGR